MNPELAIASAERFLARANDIIGIGVFKQAGIGGEFRVGRREQLVNWLVLRLAKYVPERNIYTRNAYMTGPARPMPCTR